MNDKFKHIKVSSIIYFLKQIALDLKLQNVKCNPLLVPLYVIVAHKNVTEI